jgi:hypothetical protein
MSRPPRQFGWLRFALVFCLFVALLGWGVAARADITAAQAAEAVRKHAQNPGLQLPAPTLVTEPRRSLRFRLPDGTDYWVDAKDGLVWRVSYPEPEPEDVGPNPDLLGREAVLERARALVSAQHPRLLEGVLEVQVQEGPQASRVSFNEVLPENGALSGNRVSVSLDRRTGGLIALHVTDEPVPLQARAEPAITREQAVERARQAADMVRLFEARNIGLGWFQRGQRLTWGMQVEGDFGSGYFGHRFVSLDAQTGAVLRVDRPRTPDRPIAEAGARPAPRESPSPQGPAPEAGPPAPEAGEPAREVADALETPGAREGRSALGAQERHERPVPVLPGAAVLVALAAVGGLAFWARQRRACAEPGEGNTGGQG